MSEIDSAVTAMFSCQGKETITFGDGLINASPVLQQVYNDLKEIKQIKAKSDEAKKSEKLDEPCQDDQVQGSEGVESQIHQIHEIIPFSKPCLQFLNDSAKVLDLQPPSDIEMRLECFKAAVYLDIQPQVEDLGRLAWESLRTIYHNTLENTRAEGASEVAQQNLLDAMPDANTSAELLWHADSIMFWIVASNFPTSRSQRLKNTILQHQMGARRLRFSSDRCHLMVLSLVQGDGQLTLWDIQAKPYRKFQIDAVWDAVFLPDNRMVSSSFDTVTIHKLDDQVTTVETIELPGFYPGSIRASNASFLVFGNGRKHNQAWNSSSYQWIADEPFGFVSQLEFSADGRFVVSATGNSLHIHYLTEDESTIHELDTENDRQRPLKILCSPDSGTVAAIYECYVRLWSLELEICKFQVCKILVDNMDDILYEAITFSPTSRHLLIGDSYGCLSLLNCETQTNKILAAIPIPGLESLAWHPDGRFAAAGVGSDVLYIDLQEFLTT